MTLSNLVRDVLDEGNQPDPRLIAEAVVNRTPPAQIHRFYTDAVSERVRTELRRLRTRVVDEADLPYTVDWWNRLCALAVHVGGNQWKHLGACTVTDLRFATNRQHGKSDRHGFYDDLQTAITRYRVDTVADLPELARRELVRRR